MTRQENEFSKVIDIIPYLLAHRGAKVNEVCEKFDISRQELLTILDDLKYTGPGEQFSDDLINVTLDGNDDDLAITIDNVDYLSKPVKLPHSQIAILLLGLKLLRPLVSDEVEPLVKRCEEELLKSFSESGAFDFDIVEGDEFVLGALAKAMDEGKRIHLYYNPPNSSYIADYVVDPTSTIIKGKYRYLSAFEVNSGRWWTYRMDQISELEVLDVPAEDHGPEPVFGSWLDTVTDTLKLRLRHRAKWVSDYYTTRSSEEDGKDLIVEIPLASQRFGIDLVRRLGADAELLSPASLRQVVADRAADVLGEYERAGLA